MTHSDDDRWSPRGLLEWLQRDAGIACPTISHPALRTVEDSRRHREIATGAYTKNLFVRNKKGRMWLLTLLESRSIELKSTAKLVGAGNFSFASTERLERHLGVIPGAVSPLALVNDREGQVQFVLDRGILEHRQVHFHPLDNTRTTTLDRGDFLKFLELVEHPPALLDFDADGVPVDFSAPDPATLR